MSLSPSKGSCKPWMILFTNDSTLSFNASSSMNAGVVKSSSNDGFDMFKFGLRTGGKFIKSSTEVSASTCSESRSPGLDDDEILGFGVMSTVGKGRSLELYIFCVM